MSLMQKMGIKKAPLYQAVLNLRMMKPTGIQKFPTAHLIPHVKAPTPSKFADQISEVQKGSVRIYDICMVRGRTET